MCVNVHILDLFVHVFIYHLLNIQKIVYICACVCKYVIQLKKEQCKLHHFHWWNWWSETDVFISSPPVSGKQAGFFSLL